MFNTMTAVTLCGTTLFALWIRRFTWTNDWEKAVTLSIGLQGAAFLLTIPASNGIGIRLAQATGMHNLEDIIGHDIYLVAASSVAYHALYSLSDDEHLGRRFRATIEAPASIALPALFITYMQSDSMHISHHDMFAATDPTLTPYWTVLAGFVSYLLAVSIWEFCILYTHPDYRSEVRWYIVAGVSGIIACIIRGTNHWLQLSAATIWASIAICTMTYALSSAWAWKQRSKRESPDPDLLPA